MVKDINNIRVSDEEEYEDIVTVETVLLQKRIKSVAKNIEEILATFIDEYLKGNEWLDVSIKKRISEEKKFIEGLLFGRPKADDETQTWNELIILFYRYQSFLVDCLFNEIKFVEYGRFLKKLTNHPLSFLMSKRSLEVDWKVIKYIYNIFCQYQRINKTSHRIIHSERGLVSATITLTFKAKGDDKSSGKRQSLSEYEKQTKSLSDVKAQIPVIEQSDLSSYELEGLYYIVIPIRSKGENEESKMFTNNKRRLDYILQKINVEISETNINRHIQTLNKIKEIELKIINIDFCSTYYDNSILSYVQKKIFTKDFSDYTSKLNITPLFTYLYTFKYQYQQHETNNMNCRIRPVSLFNYEYLERVLFGKIPELNLGMNEFFRLEDDRDLILLNENKELIASKLEDMKGDEVVRGILKDYGETITYKEFFLKLHDPQDSKREKWIDYFRGNLANYMDQGSLPPNSGLFARHIPRIRKEKKIKKNKELRLKNQTSYHGKHSMQPIYLFYIAGNETYSNFIISGP